MAPNSSESSKFDDVKTNDPTTGSNLNLSSGKEKKRKKKKRKKRSKEEKDADEDGDRSDPNAKRQKLSTGDPTEDEAAAPSSPDDQTVNAPNKKKRKNNKKKKDRRTKNPTPVSDSAAAEKEASAAKVPEQEDAEEVAFPYPTDPDDHCESPLQAYAHIQPLLLLLQAQNKSKKELRIYDPYYCNGAVIENLTALGFPSVYNKKEDCYQTWASSSSPEFDVFLTNPPYSSDHVEKLVEHITSPKMAKRPWLLLMPDWVHKKDYFVSQMKRKQIQPFYLVPKKRYVYLPPKNYRAAKKSDVHKKSSPFNSMWYIWGGTPEQNNRLIQHYHNTRNCMFPQLDPGNKHTSVEGASTVPLSQACALARSKSALRDLRRKVKKK